MQNTLCSQIFLKDKTNVGTIICWNFSFCRIVHTNSMGKMCISKCLLLINTWDPWAKYLSYYLVNVSVWAKLPWSKTPEVTTYISLFLIWESKIFNMIKSSTHRRTNFTNSLIFILGKGLDPLFWGYLSFLYPRMRCTTGLLSF